MRSSRHTAATRAAHFSQARMVCAGDKQRLVCGELAATWLGRSCARLFSHPLHDYHTIMFILQSGVCACLQVNQHFPHTEELAQQHVVRLVQDGQNKEQPLQTAMGNSYPVIIRLEALAEQSPAAEGKQLQQVRAGSWGRGCEWAGCVRCLREVAIAAGVHTHHIRWVAWTEEQSDAAWRWWADAHLHTTHA